ncbi:hypothetical protein OURE66S_01169 [Oligella ureolytica]
MGLQAIRQSERRVKNLGASPKSYQLVAFIWSAVGTGLAGILWVNYAGLVMPDMALWMKSGEFLAMVVLGWFRYSVWRYRRRYCVFRLGAYFSHLDLAPDACDGSGFSASGALR